MRLTERLSLKMRLPRLRKSQNETCGANKSHGSQIRPLIGGCLPTHPRCRMILQTKPSANVNSQLRRGRAPRRFGAFTARSVLWRWRKDSVKTIRHGGGDGPIARDGSARSATSNSNQPPVFMPALSASGYFAPCSAPPLERERMNVRAKAKSIHPSTRKGANRETCQPMCLGPSYMST